MLNHTTQQEDEMADPRDCELLRVKGHHAYTPWQGNLECAECGEPAPDYRSADNYPVTVDAKFWNNDLRVVAITRLAAIPARAYADTGETATWHDTTDGMSDTLTGRMRPYGRLARYFEGADAERFPPGTRYADRLRAPLPHSDGAPFGGQPEPSRARRADHFERVELPRGTNRDGVVRITQPGTKRASGPKQPKPAKTPRASLRATIRVIRPA